MGKRSKQSRPVTKSAGKKPTEATEARQSSVIIAHPPAKSPTLLAVSIVLFAAWFVFLLVTALLA